MMHEVRKVRDALSSIPDIDHEILDWLAAINSYRGVCTLNSCAGHNDHIHNQPFVVLAFFKGSPFYKFCRELSPVRSDVGPVLTLFPDKSWIVVFPPLKDVSFGDRVTPERLPTVRKELFGHIIATLEKVIERKASEKEIEVKIKFLREGK